MTQEINSDLAHVKQLIESRTKFISLSGLSGVLAGLYALVGAFLAYRIIYKSRDIVYYDLLNLDFSPSVLKLIAIAVSVFLLALISSYILSAKKAKKEGLELWNKAAYRLVESFIIPLIVGGIFIMFLIFREQITLVAPSCLLFYGLALVNASHFTFKDVKYLGYAQIILGIINLSFIGSGLYFWAMGFGVFHIIYGIMMFLKYEK